MSDKRLLLLNYLFFIAFNLIITSFQSSLWVQLFAPLPAPHFWVPTIAFWALYRSTAEGFVMLYIMTTLIGAFTSAPLGLLLLVNLCLFGISRAIKSKVYQPGPLFFAIVCSIATLAFVPLQWVLSVAFEKNSLSEWLLGDWIAKVLFTPLIAFATYPIFVKIDDITEKELPTETGRQFE